MSKDDLVNLLEFNCQAVPTGLTKLLNLVSDVMVFGNLDLCPKCKLGPLSYSNGMYKCGAMIDDWIQCDYKTRQPERKPFKIPENCKHIDCL